MWPQYTGRYSSRATNWPVLELLLALSRLGAPQGVIELLSCSSGVGETLYTGAVALFWFPPPFFIKGEGGGLFSAAGFAAFLLVSFDFYDPTRADVRIGC